jgi:thiol-disulfide isomerase/thioredoxin
MRTRRLWPLAVSLLFLAADAMAQGPTQVTQWQGSAQIATNGSSFTVPVHLQLEGKGSTLVGSFVDGPQRTTSTSGELSGQDLTLHFAHYAVTFHGQIVGDQLTGNYSADSGRFSYPLTLRPAPKEAVVHSAANVPSIDGTWIIPTESPKGEHAWRLVIRQNGGDVSATILRVDGDTGTLHGSYQDGRFIVSHFQEVRPAMLEITPERDNTLTLKFFSTHVNAPPGTPFVLWHAVRPSQVASTPQPDDFAAHTVVRDPRQPFPFSGKDLDGKLVTNLDPRFRGKVVLVNITGSWCPNCHDEAPFLAELYSKYHAQGLEIVALDFEEPEQITNLTRLHAFIERYKLDYTFLIAGVPAELNQKLPQVENLNAWPTTFFLNRQGLVHRVETGFPSSGSTEYHRDVKAAYVQTIETLLAER